MTDQPLDPTLQQAHATLLQALANLAESNRHTQQVIEQGFTRQEQASHQQSQKIDQLADQIGRLTEGMTEFRLRLEQLEVVTHEQAETSKRQERNIDRLVGIVEALIQRN